MLKNVEKTNKHAQLIISKKKQDNENKDNKPQPPYNELITRVGEMKDHIHWCSKPDQRDWLMTSQCDVTAARQPRIAIRHLHVSRRRSGARQMIRTIAKWLGKQPCFLTVGTSSQAHKRESKRERVRVRRTERNSSGSGITGETHGLGRATTSLVIDLMMPFPS